MLKVDNRYVSKITSPSDNELEKLAMGATDTHGGKEKLSLASIVCLHMVITMLEYIFLSKPVWMKKPAVCMYDVHICVDCNRLGHLSKLRMNHWMKYEQFNIYHR